MRIASTICGHHLIRGDSRPICLGVNETLPSSAFWAASLALHALGLWLFMPVSWFPHPEVELDVVTLRFVSPGLPQAPKSPPPPPPKPKSLPAARPHFKPALAAASAPPVVVPLPRFIVTSAEISPWSLCLPPKLAEPDPELELPLLPPPKSRPLPEPRPHFVPALAADANGSSGTLAASGSQEGASSFHDGGAGSKGNALGTPDGSGTQGGGSNGKGGPLTIPAYRQTPLPAYPPLAKARQWEGVTLLRVEVLVDGSVGRVELLASSGHNELDESAMRAVQRWKFEPARRGDMTVAFFIKVPIRFRLERSKA